MADNTSNRGFASMNEDKQRKISSEGGKASPTKFGSDQGADPHKAGEAGAAAQPTEAKREGGRNSHKNS